MSRKNKEEIISNRMQRDIQQLNGRDRAAKTNGRKRVYKRVIEKNYIPTSEEDDMASDAERMESENSESDEEDEHEEEVLNDEYHDHENGQTDDDEEEQTTSSSSSFEEVHNNSPSWRGRTKEVKRRGHSSFTLAFLQEGMDKR
jgi:Mg-chelatase subunit ChlI